MHFTVEKQQLSFFSVLSENINIRKFHEVFIGYLSITFF